MLSSRRWRYGSSSCEDPIMGLRVAHSLTAALMVLTAVSAWAATTPEQRCEATKIKTTGQKA